MRSFLLLLGWLLISVVIFFAGFVLYFSWSFWSWHGPQPEHTGLIEMLVWVAAFASLVWLSRLCDRWVSRIGTLLLSLIAATLGLMSSLDPNIHSTPAWFRWLLTGATMIPLAAWCLGWLIRYITFYEPASRDSLAHSLLQSDEPPVKIEPPRWTWLRITSLVLVSAILVALGVGHWWWQTRVCATTPAAFIRAVEQGDLAAAEWAFDRGHHEALGPRGLESAARHGDTPMVQFLLQRGVDPRKAVGAVGCAAASGNLETVKVLLDARADPLVCVFGSGTALHAAAAAGANNVVEYLLQQGMPIDIPDKDGNTPLIHAALQAKPEAVELLLRRGADRNKRNHQHQTVTELVAASIVQTKAQFPPGHEGDPMFSWFPEKIKSYERIRDILANASH